MLKYTIQSLARKISKHLNGYLYSQMEECYERLIMYQMIHGAFKGKQLSMHSHGGMLLVAYVAIRYDTQCNPNQILFAVHLRVNLFANDNISIVQ